MSRVMRRDGSGSAARDCRPVLLILCILGDHWLRRLRVHYSAEIVFALGISVSLEDYFIIHILGKVE